MPSTINANNSTGLVYSSDTSGQLLLQTNGTTALTVDSSQNVSISKLFASSGNISGLAGSNPAMSVGYSTTAGTANALNASNGYTVQNLTVNSGVLQVGSSGGNYSYYRYDGYLSINNDTFQAIVRSGTGALTFSYAGSGSVPAYVWGTNGISTTDNTLFLTSSFFTRGLGFGGTDWASTGAYGNGAVYTNSNPYPIALSFLVSTSYGSGYVTVYVNGQGIGSSASNNGGQQLNIFVIVPAGGTWQVVGGAVYGAWILQ